MRGQRDLAFPLRAGRAVFHGPARVLLPITETVPNAIYHVQVELTDVPADVAFTPYRYRLRYSDATERRKPLLR